MPNDDTTRPDPDQILNLLKEEEHKKERTRGYHKIFLGYVAGVGKTYRMLCEARALKEKGENVLIGVVETHKRAETESLLADLDFIPKKKIDYKNLSLEEMDLDTILERKPKYVLVDELAHTNVPGSRHNKRYQDVEELLNSGISVYSTVNIQHIQSLGEIIYQITGIEVKETVPDSIFERADKIELIDLPVEEHLQRLSEGKVYVPDKAKLAAVKFFREGNLLALRELALRYTAKRVDDAMLSYKKLHKIRGMWQTNARLLVCISPSPTSEYLIHMTQRYADDLDAEWFAVYIESARYGSLSENQKYTLEKNIHLAEKLGGRVVRLNSISPADEIISFAGSKNITLIILGYSRRTYVDKLLRGSLVNDIIEKSSTIQVLLLDSSGAIPQSKSKVKRKAKKSFHWKSLFTSFLSVAITSLLCYTLRSFLTITDVPMLFLIPVIYSGVMSGVEAGISASIMAVMAVDFFFVEPYFTFRISDIRFITTFLVIFLVGTFTSILSDVIRRQNEFSRKRERYLSTLYHFSRNLLSFSDLQELLKYTVKEISNLFGFDVVILIPDSNKNLLIRGRSKKNIIMNDHEKSIAAWVFSHGEQAGLGTDTLQAIKWRCFPLKVKQGVIGVLAISPSSGDFTFSPEEESQLDSLSSILSLAIANSPEMIKKTI